MEQTRTVSMSSVKDIKMVSSFKPVLEILRDRIGSTKVIKVPAEQRGQEHFSRLLRRPRGSFESMMTNSSKATEFSLVKGTASGASATIFKGYQDSSLRSVAIKRINGERFRGHEAELQQLLDREILALEELSECPYVTKFFEYINYAPKDEHWMVMEFCDGGSAIDLLRETIPLSQISAIVASVIRALEFIHSKGYIHGDIKCANILLCSPGIVKVCDFGLASKVKEVDNPDFHALGTVDYMAPEVMLRSLAIDNEEDFEEFNYNRKIDIWAVGIVVLELLIGHPPMHYYRHFEEDEFSTYISGMSEGNRRQSALFDLFFYADAIHDIVADHFIGKKKGVPLKDFEKLLNRFPELPTQERQFMELLHMMSEYGTTVDTKCEGGLFNFNINKVVGAQRASKMYHISKCLSFVSQCLMIDDSQRPEAKEISHHPFIRAQYKEYVLLEDKVQDIIERSKSRSTRKTLWKDFKCSLTVRQVNTILKQKEKKMRTRITRKKLN